MAELLNLPNELLLMIINEVLPDDIENFSQTCNTIYGLSKHALKKHAAMKETYSELVFNLGAGGHNKWHPAFLIRDMLLNHRTTFYPAEVVFTDQNLTTPIFYDHGHDTNEALKNEAPGTWIRESPTTLDPEVPITLSRFKDEISFLVQNHPYVENSELARQWLQLILQGCSPASFALLLIMIPNVRRIVLRDSLGQASTLGRLFHIAMPIHDSPSSNVQRPMALSKLSEVMITETRVRDRIGYYPLSLWEKFAALPCMRSIHGRYFRAALPQNAGLLGDESLGRVVPLPSKFSIEQIRLEDSSISARDLESILNRMPVLREFTYSHDWYSSTARDEPHPFEPQAMVAILLNKAKSTLTYLDFTDDCGAGSDGSPERYSIGSLRAFTALEHIRLNVVMFKSLSPTPYLLQPLVEILPASVRQLDLSGRIQRDNAIELLSGLLECREERVPNLRRITFMKRIPFPRETMYKFYKAGIELTLS